MKRKRKSPAAGIKMGLSHEKREANVGDRGLWRAVVLQTIDDYFLAGGHEQWKSERLICGDQKGYFDVICENGGYNADWVRRRVKEHEARGDMSAELRKLKRQPMGYAKYVLGEWCNLRQRYD
jgi:hypothetical protein